MTRRIKAFRFSNTILMRLIRTGKEISHVLVREGVPEDARIIGAKYDPYTDCIEIVVSSKEFEELLDGNIPEVHYILIEDIKCHYKPEVNSPTL